MSDTDQNLNQTTNDNEDNETQTQSTTDPKLVTTVGDEVSVKATEAFKKLKAELDDKAKKLAALETEKEEQRQKELAEKGKWEELAKEKDQKIKELVGQTSLSQSLKSLSADENSEFYPTVFEAAKSKLQYNDKGEVTNLDQVVSDIQSKYPSLFVPKEPKPAGSVATAVANSPSQSGMSVEQALRILNDPNAPLSDEADKVIQQAIKDGKVKP